METKVPNLEKYLSSRLRKLIGEHLPLVLIVTATLSIPNIVFWSYTISFGSVVIGLSDSAYYFGFIFHLIGVVFLASALGAFALGVFVALASFFPRWLLKYRRVRWGYRLLRTSIVLRVVCFSVFFLPSYFGFGNLSLLFLSQGAVFAISFTVGKLWVTFFGAKIVPNPDESRPSKFVAMSDEAFESLTYNEALEYNRILSSTLLHLKEKSAELDESIKSANRLIRKRKFQLNLLQKALIGVAAIVPVYLGVLRADAVKDAQALEFHVFQNSESKIRTGSIIGHTSSHLLVFDFENQQAVAYALGSVSVREN